MSKKSAYKLGWFSTGRGKGSLELLKTVAGGIMLGDIQAEIEFVFCSREPGEAGQTDLFLKQVDNYDIPLVCFSYQKFKAGRKGRTGNKLSDWRLDYDREVRQRLAPFNPDLCILAGYMLIVGKELCQKYNMINLHPAAPGGPTGTWQEVIWKLIEIKAKETGVMMHLVTPELDKGPVVTYCTFPIRGEAFDKYWQEIEGKPVADIKRTEGENNGLFKLIRQYGMARELPLITATTKTFSAGKIRVSPRKEIINARGEPIKGYNLTAEINKQLKIF